MALLESLTDLTQPHGISTRANVERIFRGFLPPFFGQELISVHARLSAGRIIVTEFLQSRRKPKQVKPKTRVCARLYSAAAHLAHAAKKENDSRDVH